MSEFTLYLGDCLEYMKSMPDKSINAVITDPPYGIDYINGGGHRIEHGWNEHLLFGDWDKNRPDKIYFDEILRIGKKVIIWGGNYFTDYLFPSMQWLIWDKGQRNFSLADCELAWSNSWNAARIYEYSRSKALSDGKVHPTQKPISLMKWCIDLTGANTIFDPFMGGGTTGVACMQLGKNFIGCEIDPNYYAIAEKRIKQAAMQGLLPIFMEADKTAEQLTL